ncbi:nitroreductase family protein [Actinacidiphila acididurans]|uniref:Nitroreductase family protein n=1 Tax=Actinacidiphila acididurans TaxID=2784346 RepID=A0ABS2U7I3_9ACTN|nr:nitroreductase family protein [Actinacidiphila acididurans]MBM9510470.1 nitroreductase family protein [Actinacidiphila acididurans]
METADSTDSTDPTNASDPTQDLIVALEHIGAVTGGRDSWRRFHAASSSPVRLPAGHDPFLAYDMPRMTVTGAPALEPKPVEDPARIDELASRRRSADLGSVVPRPAASLEAAIGLAYGAYRPQTGGHRAVASGGALYPLHFWVIGADDAGAPRRILAVDHDRAAVLEAGTVDAGELPRLFGPEPGVLRALDQGAAAVLIAADPTRTVHKYGDRGWRFALMECGAAMHHISLAATALGLAVRPIGGFDDRAVQALLSGPAVPLLFLVVVAP